MGFWNNYRDQMLREEIMRRNLRREIVDMLVETTVALKNGLEKSEDDKKDE